MRRFLVIAMSLIAVAVAVLAPVARAQPVDGDDPSSLHGRARWPT